MKYFNKLDYVHLHVYKIGTYPQVQNHYYFGGMMLAVRVTDHMLDSSCQGTSIGSQLGVVGNHLYSCCANICLERE